MNVTASILAVDRNPEALAGLTRVLEAAGYGVRATACDQDALRSLEAEAPDLVILDVPLDGTDASDGLEVCRRLKAQPQTREIPVILTSECDEAKAWVHGLQLGAADYLLKPYQPEELLTRVNTQLTMRWANRALVRQTESLRAEILRREQVETELREREVLFRNLADSGLALIWLADTDKLCFYFNAPWLRFTGRTLDQERGNGWAEGVHSEDLDRCFDTYVKAFDRREPFEMEYRLKHHSGEYRWILDMGTPNFDSHGAFQGYIGHCFDITDRIKYQEALQRNDKLDSLGLLAGGIAHDFNNLLAGLFAYVSLAKDHSPAGSPAAGYLDKACAAFDRAKDLTRQLLTFSKGGTPERKPGHLGPLLREATEFALSGSPVHRSFDLAADLHPCEFDANQIGQVINNLVINAQQAMPEGGHIALKACNRVIEGDQHPGLAPGRYVEIALSDTGTGIPPSVLPRIFDPFFTTKPQGNGLGLPTCYSIVHRHGGTIEVQSVVGQGTTFRVLLPATDHQPSATPSSAEVTHRGSGTLLVLDDEELLRDLAGEWLGELGYRVVAVRDGREALAALDASPGPNPPWTAALLDLTVPGGVGGKETVAGILERFPQMPVFATSGYFDDPVMANPQAFRFTASLQKPYRKEELVSLLSQHLGGSL